MSRAATVLALLALAACDPPSRGPQFRAAGASAPRDGGTLRFSVIDSVHTLDPALANDETSYYVMHAMFDTLVDFAPTGRDLIPRLAERWDVSPDGLSYTFWLRAGIAFHDGTPITAADCKYSLERTRASKDSPFSPYLADLEDITAAGDRQLVIRLARRNAAFLAILAMPFATPQRRAYVDSFTGARADQLRRMPDANGPFELERWDEGSELVLRRNPHYYDAARAHLDRIVMHERVAHDTQFELFERGELDTAERLAAPDYLYVVSDPAWQPYLHRGTTMNVFGSRMNTRVPPFNDRRVRQAFNYAIDHAHTARLLQGTTEPAHGMLPPGMLGRDDRIAPYPHDVARARQLLAEAGYPDGLAVRYVVPSDDEAERVAAAMANDLAAAGVQVTLSVTTLDELLSEMGSMQGPAFSFASWIPDFADPINFFEPNFHSRSISDTGSNNNTFYANPTLDQLLDQAHEATDPAQRAALYRQAERILYDDPPWIWDYHRASTEVVQPYVKGFTPHAIWVRDYTSVWLDLGPDGQPEPR